MPSIIVRTGKLPVSAKEAIGPSFNETVHSLLKVGMVEIFFDEHDLYFINGQKAGLDHVTFAMEGPPLTEEIKAQLAAKFDELYRSGSGLQDVRTTFVYHANTPDSVASNGQLHSLRPPKPSA